MNNAYSLCAYSLPGKAYNKPQQSLPLVAGTAKTLRLFGRPCVRPWQSSESPRMKVYLSDYQHEWPDLLEREKAALFEKLGPWLHGTSEHVGSTAVPGLKAKPIIDIMVGVEDLDSSVGAIDLLQDS